MLDPEELVHKLENSMSGPAAEALREFILENDATSAHEVMLEEGLSADEGRHLYEYLRKKWTGTRLVLTEVPLAEAEALLRTNEPLGADEESPRYLVRHGLSITQSRVYLDLGQVQLFIAGRGPVPLNSIHQIWRITEEPQ